jgi:hypothetical protein
MIDPEPQDDLSIAPTAVLWRRIYPDHRYIHQEPDGKYRASSLAFDDGPYGDPMSMFLAAEALDERVVLAGHDTFGLASLTAQVIRENHQIIVRDPADIPGHVLVIGEKTHRVRQRFAKAADLIRLPQL